jgi:hypothetical protein
VQPTTVVETLVACWEDIPRLVGASWAQLFPHVVDLAAALRQTSNPDRQARLAMQLALLFKDHPPVAGRLRQALEASHRRSPAEGEELPSIPDWSAALDGLDERLGGPTSTRLVHPYPTCEDTTHDDLSNAPRNHQAR